MTIGVDLNDVLRDFTMNFAKYYRQGYDHSFDYDELELWTNDPQSLFKFKSEQAYEKFAYQDYAYELYGACPTCELQLSAAFNDWVTEVVPNIDSKEMIDIIMVSPMEYSLSIPSTYFFLSKIGCKVRKIFLPSDSSEIWEKCDAVITANPLLLNTKPKEKIVIKIETEYNKNIEADVSFVSMKQFMEDEENVKAIVNKKENER